MTATPKLDRAELSRFTGTEHWYRHALNHNVLYTDGAKYVADVRGAHWLLDLIAVSQLHDKRLSRQPFQVWRLALRHDRSATITVEDGNYNVLRRYPMELCDFPTPGITLWFSNGVIYLPSEH